MLKNEILIDLKAIKKHYFMGKNTVTALKAVDLQIRKGEWVGIMGPSGSGKSTLMHIIGCLDRPSSGSYFLNQSDVSTLDDHALSLIRASKMGFVFQSYNLIPQLNVYENVEIPFFYGNETTSDDRKNRILTAIDQVGLKARKFHLPTELSGGEMQRAAIARAIVINPLIILADEPTGNLDSTTGLTILEVFKTLHLQGVTLIMVTHDEEVGKHCQRMVRLRDGEIISDTASERV
jgi:putative ABC transport system ATP-binding protein